MIEIGHQLKIGKLDCLEPLKPVCGNGYVEPTEKCDCGSSEQCAILQDCCIPDECSGWILGCKPKRPSE